MSAAKRDLIRFLLDHLALDGAANDASRLVADIKKFRLAFILREMLSTLDETEHENVIQRMDAQKRLNEAFKDELGMLLHATRKAGIDFIYCKGLSLAIDLYDPVETRTGKDIDILVELGDLERMLDLLGELGYVLSSTNEVVTRAIAKVVHNSQILIEIGQMERMKDWGDGKIKIKLDLHVSLFIKQLKKAVEDTREIFGRSVEESLFGHAFKLLELHDRIVHLLVHFRSTTRSWVLSLF